MSLTAAVLLSATISGHDPIFVMDKEHCEVLRSHAKLAMDLKPANTYQNYVRTLFEIYRYSEGKRTIVLDNIMPYSLEVGYEYFHSPFDPETPYAQMVYERCMDSVGSPAK